MERIEYRNLTTAIPSSEAVVPVGYSNNTYLRYRNTFYWDKRAWAQAPGDYTKARIFHWLHTQSQSQTAGVLESEKKPLENRVWYLYPGQARPYDEGSSTRPTSAARVLDDGTTQKEQYEYNARGHKTKALDPLGRETVYVYGTNNVPDANPTTGEGMDLLQVKQKNGGSYDVLASYTYNAVHQALTTTDARGSDDKLHIQHGRPGADRHDTARRGAQPRAPRRALPTTPTAISPRWPAPFPAPARASPMTTTDGGAPPRMRQA